MTTVYNIDIFNNATGEFDIGTVTLNLASHTIGFLRSRRHGDNIVVTYVNHLKRRQEVVVLPGRFYDVVPAASGLGFAGCVDITAKQLRALGVIA